MTKVFIDGSAGTTGLRIYDRISQRRDIELISLSDSLRKDSAARREALNRADIAFLCLPDDTAKEAAAMVENPATVIIDTSTAHRTDEKWCYGFPELAGQREKILSSKRIANPGCHASGFISLVAPLVRSGILSDTAKLSCFSLTGYSGGGKKMIAEYENPDNADALRAPRMYGLSQQHKHLPEMAKICGLTTAPVFSPIVSSFYSGMEVVVPLFAEEWNGRIEDIKAVYQEVYRGPVVSFAEAPDEGGFLSAGRMSGRDDMQIFVYGNEERVLLVSRFDNLGKGASGAAIQNMNLVLGVAETTGLNIGG